MEIKEIYVEAKKSKNFQTYTVGIRADVETSDHEIRIKELQAKCRKLVNEQIQIDGR